jgi:NADH-quinone oxidoreductase subunit A
MQGYLTMAVFAVVGIGMVAVSLILNRLLSPSAPSPEKLETYECGPAPFGNAWRQFNMHYYLYALLFLVFDVEAVFLFPWALAMRQGKVQFGATFLVVELAIFVGLLAAGWAWAWRRGAMEWE